MALFSSFTCGNRGVAIVAVTMVLVVVALLGGAIVAQTNHNTQLSNRTFSDKQALYIAESAKERGYQEILNDGDFTVVGAPGTLANVTIPGGSYNLTATTLQADPKIVQLTATGTSITGDSKQITVVAEVIQENVCVWNNALFGGSGAVGGVINGNAAIHGSVHLLGGGVGEGNNSIEALDLSGASLIHNNYTGMPAELLAKIPALPTTTFGGEEIATIDANLRVKNGAVGVSGSSEIGEANIVGNGIKETMDGIYIETDSAETRWTGNQVTDGVPDPASVQSDNGTEALYDLGDAVQMPDLNEPYEDSLGNSYATYDEYFDSPRALELDFSLTLDDSNSAATDVEANRPALEALGYTVDVVDDRFVIQDGIGNTFAYDPTVAADQAGLVVRGMVRIEGDIVLGEKNLDITYAGKGTIYAAGNDGGDPGNIDVHSNILPAGQFPTVGVLGIMAKNDIALADGPGDSQLMMAGAFYAEHQIISTKQNQILGTFVCNYFDMGTNVPKIYQVPTLVENLPPGMIASEPIWVVTGFEEKSWRVD